MNKKLLTVAIGAALAVAGNAYALEAKLSGQVNRALMYADDGRQSELHHVDNSNSGTRFRFTGNDQLSSGVKAGVNLEFEYLSNSSSSVTQTAKSVNPGLNERIMEVYFEGSAGRLSMGQGPGAADGIIEVDVSGTAAAHYSGTVTNLGGAITFLTTAGVAGPSISSVTSNFDPGRKDRLRYDSPALGPVKVSASTGVGASDTINELAVWVDQDFGGNKLSAGLGWTNEDTNSATTGWKETKGFSVSWLAPFGLGVTAAWATQEDDNATAGAKLDADFTYLKVSHKMGEHAFSVDWGKTDDLAVKGDESKQIGLGYVYAPTKWSDFYVNLKKHTLDRSGGTATGTGTTTAAATYEDIKLLTAGVRLKF